MPHLRPCPKCSRHVRADEARCPFCDGALSVDNNTKTSAAPSRLGRAAMMAFGTAIVATAAAAGASCGGAQSSGSGSPTAESDAGPQDPPNEDPRGNRRDPDDGPPNPAMPYGAPPADGLFEVV